MNFEQTISEQEIQASMNTGGSSKIYTEFFFNLLPCYIFLITAYVRYKQIQKELLENQAPKLVELSTEEDMFYKMQFFRQKPASFMIKRYLSLFVAGSYLIQILLIWLFSEDYIFETKNFMYDLVYLVGFAAWSMSYYLIEVEYDNSLGQVIYNHRLFWPFSMSLLLVDIFSDEKTLVLNLLIDFVRLGPEVCLTVYALYKANDQIKIDNTMNMNFEDQEEEIPTWAQAFFEKIENKFDEIVRKKINTPQNQQELLTKQNDNDVNMEYEAYLGSEGISDQQNQDKYLQKLLPTRTALAINKKMVMKMINQNEIKYYFQIITQINSQRFIAERRFIEFVELQKDLMIIFNMEQYPNYQQNVPKLDQGDISKAASESGEIQEGFAGKRAESLEKFLQYFLNYPQYMHPKVLDFLNLDDDEKAPYLTYFTHKQKNNKILRKKQVTVQVPLEEKIALTQSKTQAPTFNFVLHAKVIDWQKCNYGRGIEYLIQISNVSKSPRQTWNIKKTYNDIKEFNREMENKLGKDMHYLKRNVPKNHLGFNSADDPRFLKQMQDGIQKYLQEIFDQNQLFCDTLFDFIQYDGKKQKILNQNTNFSERSSVVSNYDEKQIDSIDNGNFETEDPSVINNLLNHIMGNSNNETKELKGINFSKTIARLVQIKQILGQNNEYFYLYNINLEEYDSNKQIITKIKIQKNYQDFVTLQMTIIAIYDGTGVKIPKIPNEKTGNKYNPQEKKSEFDNYFLAILKLPKIYLNETFQNFFSLHKINPQFKIQRSNQLEEFDFILHQQY